LASDHHQLPALAALGLFSIGTAVSSNAQSIIICRFFSGLFGSAPVSNVSAALGDIWMPKARGMALTFYAVAVVGGPTIGNHSPELCPQQPVHTEILS